MGTRKKTYKKKARVRSAKLCVDKRLGRLVVEIHGIKRNIGADYIKFMTELENRSKIRIFANTIKHKSRQWNAIRKKYVTASVINKIWKYKTSPFYICKKMHQYVAENFQARGDIIELRILEILKNRGYTVLYTNEIWIHKHIKWISCTPDGVLVDETGKIYAALEIKSYTSKNRFESAFNISDNGINIKHSSNEYSQVQMVAEVIDVPFVLLIVEYNLNIYKLLVIRDLDFLYERFDKLKLFYLSYYLPFLLYEDNDSRKTKNSKSQKYFGKIIYDRLHKILEKADDYINGYDDSSILHYYGPSKPSDLKIEYFDEFLDLEKYQRINNDKLESEKIFDENNYNDSKKSKII